MTDSPISELNKFYTEPTLASSLVDNLLSIYDIRNMLIVEPSAGAGAFVRPLRKLGFNVLALDIEPDGAGIIRGDFLKDDILPNNKKIVVIGNPPFGFASNVAIKFFNRAAEKASIIAFIVPRTFRKISVQNKLCKNFHLLYDEDIPNFAFIKDNKPHNVPCAWQVWEWKKIARKIEPPPDISHLLEYTDPANATFAFRRVGGRAGTVLSVAEAKSPSANYYMKQLAGGVKRALQEINWDSIRNSTVGVRSISKQEIAFELGKRFSI